MISTSGRRQKPSSARSGQGSARSKLVRLETVDQPGDVIDVNQAMHNEMDQDGKLDLDHASAAATVGAGLNIQDKSKQAMHRINATLAQT